MWSGNIVEVLNGFHKITLDDGCVYEGYFIDGNRIYGTKTYPNGGKYIGPYVDNIRHGIGIKITADGTKKIVEYINGELVKS